MSLETEFSRLGANIHGSLNSNTLVNASLMGWVARRRDHGGVIFIDLRDRYGLTQIVFNPQHDAQTHAKADPLRSEFVLAVQGTVEARPYGMVNEKIATGTIEVNCDQLRILNTSPTPPFLIEDSIEPERKYDSGIAI